MAYKAAGKAGRSLANIAPKWPRTGRWIAGDACSHREMEVKRESRPTRSAFWC